MSRHPDGWMDRRGRDGTGRRDARAITREVHVFVSSSTAQRVAALHRDVRDAVGGAAEREEDVDGDGKRWGRGPIGPTSAEDPTLLTPAFLHLLRILSSSPLPSSSL